MIWTTPDHSRFRAMISCEARGDRPSPRFHGGWLRLPMSTITRNTQARALSDLLSVEVLAAMNL